MSLKDRLLNDFKDAMKAKDEIRKNTVNLARAAIKQYEVDNRVELDDQGILSILTKQVKMRKDALSDFEKAGRTDLLDAYNREIEILMEYLPKQLTEEEIAEIIKVTAAELGIEGGRQNMGKLIGAVMPKVKGKADGGVVKRIVEGLL
ncbi:MAG TPA: GatB/YqeY domain-containing protein [Anaerovoracaceae bacterium]|nr:GatB/YqeY domain-containing protein [Anaerovoracaceae bacterium]